MKKSTKIPIISKVAYGMGDATFTFGTAITGFYLLIFLTNVVGLKGYLASLIIFIGFLWDAVTDPIVGHFSDKIKSKFGKRRKLMLLAVVPLALTFFGVFGLSSLVATMSPSTFGLGQNSANLIMFIKAFIVLIIYLLFYLCYTLAYIPYISLINDMTKDYNERTTLTGFRMIATIIATIIAVAVPDLIMGDITITNSGEKFILISAIFGVLMVVILLITIFGTREMDQEPVEDEYKFHIYKSFLSCFKDPNFRKASLAFMFSLSAIFVLQDTIQYYVNYWLKSPELFLPLAGGVLVLGFLSVPIWMIVASKIGKRNTLFLGSLCWIIAFSILFFLPEQTVHSVALDFQNEIYVIPLSMREAIQTFPIYGWVAVFILGVGMGNIHLTAYGMYPDAIAHVKNPLEKEGSYFGAVSFLQKLGIGFATLLIGPILDISGYTAQPSSMWFSDLESAGKSVEHTWLYLQNSDFAPLAIKIVFCLLPIILMVFASIAVKGYDLDHQLIQKK
ncbi:MAG: MFS transporter [Candidatus Izemoplasmatales bacterium]|jgi:Na+/melibiose symporter-like transporter|nr:MFS transporter [Candidatus Izemoplasmatales bacterium]